jgi:predicted dehydrogenase
MTVGLGIVGFAHGHVGMYCEQWRAHPEWGVELLAGWDRDAARLADCAERQGVTAHENLDELLAREDVSAVVIAAETAFHAELVERAAGAGKAVVLQKPLALTLPEADRIVAVVDACGAPFTVAWQMRVDPQNLKMRELLASGALGRVFMVRRRHGLSMHLWPNAEELWHADPALNRDMWADDAAHAVDFLLWLLGEPETVTAEIESLHNPKIPLDNGVAIYRYPGGPVAEVCCSFTCPAGENTTEIICEKGVVIQNYGDAPSCSVPRPADACALKWYSTETGEWTYSELPSPTSQGERIAALAEPLAEFLRGERPPLATAAEGRTALRMTLAGHLSAREGRRVRVDDVQIESL